jgi:hypothetical protein
MSSRYLTFPRMASTRMCRIVGEPKCSGKSDPCRGDVTTGSKKGLPFTENVASRGPMRSMELWVSYAPMRLSDVL